MWLIAAMLLAILAVLVLLFFKVPRSEPKPPPQNAAHLTVTDAAPGDVVVVPGAGDGFADLSFTIDRKDCYEAGGDSWFEVSGRYQGRRVYLEVCDDDDLLVLLNLANEERTLSNLGITENDLVRMDEGHDRSESFSYDGSQWQFDWSGEVTYFKDCQDQGEGYYNWDFKEKGGRRYVSIEKWEGDPFEVILSRVVHADDVQVLRS